MSLIDVRIGHPTPFLRRTLDLMSFLLNAHWQGHNIPRRLLDPFAGIGGISGIDWLGEIYGVEIEPEWANQAESNGVLTVCGDSRDLPWADASFGAICTSPAYGNRVSDSTPTDRSDPKNLRRRTYRLYLDRELTDGNGAALHWGEAYRTLHSAAWAESYRVLAPGGLFLLNVKDHIRRGKRQGVPLWHVAQLKELGLELVVERPVYSKGDQNTATMRDRGVNVLDVEWIFVLRKPMPEGG